LFVTDGISKILKVLESVQEIRNWFLLVTYSMSSPAAPEQTPEYVEDDMMPPHTMLSDVDDAESTPQPSLLKGDKVTGVKSLAEELQRERESYLEATASPSTRP
jgi:hypothetical protein